MKRILIVALALASFAVFAETDAQRTFRKWAVEKMEVLRKDKDPVQRTEAAAYLGSYKDLDVIAALGAALSDPDARVRAAAAGSLWSAGKAAEPARGNLLKALEDPAPAVVVRAAGALEGLGMDEKDLVGPRKRAFEATDAPYDARFMAARGLAGSVPSVALLDAMLEFLARSAPRQGADALAQQSSEKNIEMAAHALEELAGTGDRAIIAPLEAQARKEHPGTVVLLKTLAVFDPRPADWVELLVWLLDSRNARVRYAALGYLGGQRNAKDVAFWAPRAAKLALQDADSSVRGEALHALANARGLAASQVDAAIAATRDADRFVRIAAVRAIGEMGDPTQALAAAAKADVAQKARPALAALAEKDAEADVRAEAKAALTKLEGTTGLVAAVVPGGKVVDASAEARAVALLRERDITFDEGSFYVAITKSDLPVVRAFLDAGLSAAKPVATSGPPLVVAMFRGDGCTPTVRPSKAEAKEVVKLLLARGADANAADEHGNTPLMGAAMMGCDREMMKLLIAGGAKVNATNVSKLTAFEMGLFVGHDGLDELIAAGYRLTPAKSRDYSQTYAGKPAVLALIRKASTK
jgi:HEAT repeat protein